MRQSKESERRRLRPGRICVAIQAATPAEMISRAEAALRESKFLEFRLDSLARPDAVLTALRRFLARNKNVTAIATCRRKPNGGNFSGTLEEELEILRKAVRAGCRIADLEIESAEEAAPAQLDKFRAALRRADAELIVSFHDFSRTRQLDRAADRIAAFDPDIVKVVSTAQTLADNLAVLRLIENRAANARIVSMAMGEEGLPSRILGPREGGEFTFASLAEGEETAPGQVTARTLRTLYRAGKISEQHPHLWRGRKSHCAFAFAADAEHRVPPRRRWTPLLIPLKVRALADLLAFALELPLSGLAVTMPLKQEILPRLAQMDPLVKRIGRVQHGAHRRGRQALRLQHRRGRRGAPAGAENAAEGRARGAAGGRRRRARRGIRAGRARSGSLHRQPHPRERGEAGAGRRGHGAAAGEAARDALRCADQLDSLRHGGIKGAVAAGRRTS